MGSLAKAGSILADDPVTAYLTNFEKEDLDALLSNLRTCKVDVVSPIHDRLRCIKDSLLAAKKWEVRVTSEFGDLIKLINQKTEPPSDPGDLAKLVDGQLQVLLKGAPAAAAPPDAAAGTSSHADRHQKLQWREFPEDYKWASDPRWAGKDRPEKTRGKLFKHLEPQLVDCLKCLAVLPANAVVKKTLLIYWWIGEGIVAEMGNQTAEGVGEHCFQLLLATGFVVPIKEKLHGADTVKRCRLLPWVRDHLISKAQGGSRLLLRTSKTGDAALCDRVSVAAAVDPGRLSSVFNLNAQNLGVKREQVSRMKGVTALALGRWQDWPDHHIEVQDNTRFLDGLGAMRNLKYLSLRGISLIRELPESIGCLANLRILDLHACHNLETLTDGIAKLIQLTHLDVSDCCLLEVMPPGLMHLRELLVVKGYAIRTDAAHRGSISDLAATRIRKLSMCLGRDTQDTKDLDSLANLDDLRSLAITWGRERSLLPAPAPAKQRTMQKMFSKLKSFTSTQSAPDDYSMPLEKLDLGCVSSTLTRRWLRPELFPNLKKLYIRGGKLRSLAFGEGGWQVETLRLKSLKKLVCDYETHIRPCFPRLEWLEIVGCPKITSTPKLDKEGIWRRREGDDDDGVGAPSTSPASPSSSSPLGATVTPQPTSPPTSTGAQSPSPTTVPNGKGKEIVQE